MGLEIKLSGCTRFAGEGKGGEEEGSGEEEERGGKGRRDDLSEVAHACHLNIQESEFEISLSCIVNSRLQY